jgi:hypothetical protein
LAPKAAFSGVSGWRNPGVTLRIAVAVVVELSLAVTTTDTLSVVRYGGGVYCPLDEILPGPLFASPPDTDHVTAAGPPPVKVAVNCSTDLPCALVTLHPVQFVSIEFVLGEMEKAALLGSAATCPALQPAAAANIGVRSNATALAGQLRASNNSPRDSR